MPSMRDSTAPGCKFSLPIREQEYVTLTSHRLQSGAQGANQCQVTLLTHVFTEYFSYSTVCILKHVLNSLLNQCKLTQLLYRRKEQREHEPLPELYLCNVQAAAPPVLHPELSGSRAQMWLAGPSTGNEVSVSGNCSTAGVGLTFCNMGRILSIW